MDKMDPMDALWKVETGLYALEAIETLLGLIYKTGQDIHCLNPNHLGSLIEIVRCEIAIGFKNMPR